MNLTKTPEDVKRLGISKMAQEKVEYCKTKIMSEFEFWLWYCSFYTAIEEAPDKLRNLKKRKIKCRYLEKKAKILPNPVSLATVTESEIETCF